MHLKKLRSPWLSLSLAMVMTAGSGVLPAFSELVYAMMPAPVANLATLPVLNATDRLATIYPQLYELPPNPGALGEVGGQIRASDLVLDKAAADRMREAENQQPLRRTLGLISASWWFYLQAAIEGPELGKVVEDLLAMPEAAGLREQYEADHLSILPELLAYLENSDGTLARDKRLATALRATVQRVREEHGGRSPFVIQFETGTTQAQAEEVIAQLVHHMQAIIGVELPADMFEISLPDIEPLGVRYQREKLSEPNQSFLTRLGLERLDSVPISIQRFGDEMPIFEVSIETPSSFSDAQDDDDTPLDMRPVLLDVWQQAMARNLQDLVEIFELSPEQVDMLARLMQENDVLRLSNRQQNLANHSDGYIDLDWLLALPEFERAHPDSYPDFVYFLTQHELQHWFRFLVWDAPTDSRYAELMRSEAGQALKVALQQAFEIQDMRDPTDEGRDLVEIQILDLQERMLRRFDEPNTPNPMRVHLLSIIAEGIIIADPSVLATIQGQTISPAVTLTFGTNFKERLDYLRKILMDAEEEEAKPIDFYAMRQAVSQAAAPLGEDAADVINPLIDLVDRMERALNRGNGKEAYTFLVEMTGIIAENHLALPPLFTPLYARLGAGQLSPNERLEAWLVSLKSLHDGIERELPANYERARLWENLFYLWREKRYSEASGVLNSIEVLIPAGFEKDLFQAIHNIVVTAILETSDKPIIQAYLLYEELVGHLQDGEFVSAFETLDRFSAYLAKVPIDSAGERFELLRKELPEIRQQVETSLFDPARWGAYTQEIRQAVDAATEDADEPEALVDTRTHLLDRADALWNQGEYAAAFDMLQQVESYVPKAARLEYLRVRGNAGVLVVGQMLQTPEAADARHRWDLTHEMVQGLIQEGKNPETALVIDTELISPPHPGDAIVFSDELDQFADGPDDETRIIRREAAGRLAGHNLVSSEDTRLAEQAAKEEVHLWDMLLVGGLSRRGNIFADFLIWSVDVGWVRLADLRLAQLAWRSRRFKDAGLILLDSYHTHAKVTDVLAGARASLTIFGNRVFRPRASVTPIATLKDGKIYHPYNPDGLGVASHGDGYLQLLMDGTIADMLLQAPEEERDAVYYAAHNMNIPTSVPSERIIGHFHRTRQQAKKEGKPAPFVAFQLVGARGETGGMLGYVKTKLGPKLMIIEGFLLGKQTLPPDQYPAFNTNHAVIAANDLVRYFLGEWMEANRLTLNDINAAALAEHPERREAIREILNARMVPVDSGETLQTTDLSARIMANVEVKKMEVPVGQASIMLNTLATQAEPKRGFAPALYFMSPRDVADDESMFTRAFAEFKKAEEKQRKTIRDVIHIFMKHNAMDFKEGRDGVEGLNRSELITEVLHHQVDGSQTLSQLMQGTSKPVRVKLMVDGRERDLGLVPNSGEEFYDLNTLLWRELDEEKYGEVIVIKPGETDPEVVIMIQILKKPAAIGEPAQPPAPDTTPTVLADADELQEVLDAILDGDKFPPPSLANQPDDGAVPVSATTAADEMQALMDQWLTQISG